MSVCHKTYILGQNWMYEMLFEKMPYNQNPFKKNFLNLGTQSQNRASRCALKRQIKQVDIRAVDFGSGGKGRIIFERKGLFLTPLLPSVVHPQQIDRF